MIRTKKYFEQEMSFFKIDPSDPGVAVRAYSPNPMIPVVDMEHTWFVNNGWIELFKCNWSFKSEGKRCGCSMEDGKWEVYPYPSNYWSDMAWDNKKLSMYDPAPREINADFVKGCVPLVFEAKKDIYKDVSNIQAVAPRIALGQTHNGNLLFSWTHARPDGLSFDQLAEIMIAEKCHTAFAGDGGDSVTVVYDGKVLENKGRVLPDMLAVYVTKEWYEKNMEVKEVEAKLIHPVNRCKMNTERTSKVYNGQLKQVDGRLISSPYGPRKSGDGFHDGVDYLPIIPYVDGDPIYAAHDGLVSNIGWSKGYHNYLIIDGDGFSTLYAHYKTLNVKDGQTVKQGDVIAYMGNYNGVHLHFEYRDETYTHPRGNYWRSHDGEFNSSQDPLKYIAEDKEFIPVDYNAPVELDLTQEILLGLHDETVEKESTDIKLGLQQCVNILNGIIERMD